MTFGWLSLIGWLVALGLGVEVMRAHMLIRSLRKDRELFVAQGKNAQRRAVRLASERVKMATQLAELWGKTNDVSNTIEELARQFKEIDNRDEQEA